MSSPLRGDPVGVLPVLSAVEVNASKWLNEKTRKTVIGEIRALEEYLSEWYPGLNLPFISNPRQREPRASKAPNLPQGN